MHEDVVLRLSSLWHGNQVMTWLASHHSAPYRARWVVGEVRSAQSTAHVKPELLIWLWQEFSFVVFMENRSSSSSSRTESTDFLDSPYHQSFTAVHCMWMVHTRNSLMSLSFSLHPCLHMLLVLLRCKMRGKWLYNCRFSSFHQPFFSV